MRALQNAGRVPNFRNSHSLNYKIEIEAASNRGVLKYCQGLFERAK